MLTENFLKPGADDLHMLLSEFFEEIRKDEAVVEVIEGKINEKFEKFKMGLGDFFQI